MAWLESHQSLANHRKTLALSRLLGISRAQVIGHLHLLWWWALDNAPNGDISAIDPQDLARAVDWSGEATTIIGAFYKVGFLDEPGKIHDWEEYAGKLEYQRLKNKEYQKRFRDKQKSQLLQLNSSKTDVSLTLTSRKGATVPNSTVQYSNKEIDKESEHPITNNIYVHWNEQKIRVHKKLTPDIANAISKSLKIHNEEEICRVIQNYAEIVNHPESYWFGYKWTLKDFLTRGFDKFEDMEIARTNYKKDGGQNGTNQRYSKQGGTKLPDRDTGYTPAPPDPELDALVARDIAAQGA